MALIATRLSLQVEAGFSAVTQHMTNIEPLRSGRETRNAEWANPRRRYSAKYAKFDRAAREEIFAAVYAAQGQLHTFLFRDWNDYQVVNQSLGNTPSGSTPVQLVRTYLFGATIRSRPILHPVASTVVVRQGGVVKPGTVSNLTGLFTPTTAWAAGQPLTADFEFDVQVRFATDEMDVVMPHREIAEINCELIEVLS